MLGAEEERFERYFEMRERADRQFDRDGDPMAYLNACAEASKVGPGSSWIFDPSNDVAIARIKRRVLARLDRLRNDDQEGA